MHKPDNLTCMFRFLKLLIFILFISFLPAKETSYAQKVMLQGRQKVYKHASKGWPKIVVENKKAFKMALEELKIHSENILDDQQLDHFILSFSKRLQEGTCYGEAMTYLLASHGKKKPLVKFNREEQARVFVLQARQMGNYTLQMVEDFYHSGEVLLDKYGKKIKPFNSKDPQNATDRLIKMVDHISDLKISDFDSDRDEVINFFEKHINLNQHILYCMQLENVENSLIEQAGFKTKQLELKFKKTDNVSLKFTTELKNFYNNKPFSDLLIGIFWNKDGVRVGHAILAKFDSLIIYDAYFGIYKYDKLNHLLKDLANFSIKYSKHPDLIILNAFYH